MKIYLVGGAVRDKLMGKNPSDLDYVVVNATQEDMLKLGFKQVGNDFPVFLHPENGNEYALARIEKKSGEGYNGFEFICKDVTLEEDLGRRDLTINAIAEDKYGNVIDPFNGCKDLKNKVLKHVSDSFEEDPLRVLRLARFSAKFPDFKIHEDTMKVVQKMVSDGKINELKKERIWKEVEKAMLSKDPLKFIESLDEMGALKVLFPIIDEMKGVPQRADFHAEGDVYIHTMMVFKEAIELSKDLPNKNKLSVRMGALLHDVGKAKTPYNLLYNEDGTLKGSHVGHDEASLVIPLIDELSEKIGMTKEVSIFCKTLCIVHQNFHAFSQIKKPLKKFNFFEKLKIKSRGEDFLDDLLMACRADSYGRKITLENGEIVPAPKEYKPEILIRDFYDKFKGANSQIGKYVEFCNKSGLKPEEYSVINKKTNIILEYLNLENGKSLNFEDFLSRSQKNIIENRKEKNQKLKNN